MYPIAAGTYGGTALGFGEGRCPTGYVNVLIHASRLDRQPSCNWARDAPEFYQPDPNPSNVTNRYNYCNSYVQR
ncbi:MAG: hypothetical protein K6T75_03020 [Acetobacteraceae bacterium]|nr:hypothetical protein [Acetobacteraceae bacterium]